MKHIFRLAFLLCAAAALAAAQDVGSTGSVTARTPAAANVRRVMAPPEDRRVSLKARPSTSQSGMLHAAKPPLKELPNLALTGVDGKQRAAAPGEHAGHWLLLYRTEHCLPCDRLMNVLAASQSADFLQGARYTVIVAGGRSGTSLQQVRSSYSTLANANWVADGENTSLDLLQLHGAPVLLGMDDRRIAWRLAGNLGDPQRVLDMADRWIAGTAQAAAQTTAEKAAPAAQGKP